MSKVSIREFNEHPLMVHAPDGLPSGAKAQRFERALSARLKPCPFKAGHSQ